MHLRQRDTFAELSVGFGISIGTTHAYTAAGIARPPTAPQTPVRPLPQTDPAPVNHPLLAARAGRWCTDVLIAADSSISRIAKSLHHNLHFLH
ncbi:hypothetical protein [Streptomyces sp. NPDC088801]|uniref:hypothetical protein n=1 Tax=Streptomyces sp. NPDC088801 TaxID=3365903 RepID=UPI003812AEBC